MPASGQQLSNSIGSKVTVCKVFQSSQSDDWTL